jgi:hypothetical protein
MKSDMPTEVAIYLSKGKTLLLLFGAAAFIVLSLWIWSIADNQKRFPPFYLKSLSVVGVSFFGMCGVYGCFKAFDNRPGLIVDSTGFIDNSSAVAVGRVLWSEVTAVNVSEVSGQRFVTVMVAEPEQFNRRCGPLIRMLHSVNMRMTGSPINISANPLQISFEGLFALLASGLERHRELEMPDEHPL